MSWLPLSPWLKSVAVLLNLLTVTWHFVNFSQNPLQSVCSYLWKHRSCTLDAWSFVSHFPYIVGQLLNYSVIISLKWALGDVSCVPRHQVEYSSPNSSFLGDFFWQNRPADSGTSCDWYKLRICLHNRECELKFGDLCPIFFNTCSYHTLLQNDV